MTYNVFGGTLNLTQLNEKAMRKNHLQLRPKRRWRVS